MKQQKKSFLNAEYEEIIAQRHEFNILNKNSSFIHFLMCQHNLIHTFPLKME